ncbi:SMI1/KNR4 family protein [Massilia sp. P8910]|uniref:SMI1/KNR4 family protein n=1 Tax=Massilia antarctica TaxID=2765360 RepID=UPI001E555A41|nr:SMI1/KNR4 family protein [Massilia antarctica]MCE3606442.1 SMI1/KNR4 family protein [Massilia antarctica]
MNFQSGDEPKFYELTRWGASGEAPANTSLLSDTIGMIGQERSFANLPYECLFSVFYQSKLLISMPQGLKICKPEEVRQAFPEGTFGSPTESGTIAEAERLLGHRLPELLLNLYQEFDGFQAPTNAPFLLPVLNRPASGGESLVSYTQFFRSEPYFPAWLQRAVVLGDNGTGIAWFIRLEDENRLVRWDAEWEDYEIVKESLLESWIAERKLYESIEDDI